MITDLGPLEMVPDEGFDARHRYHSVLTFNLINSLAKKQTRSNALFWLTVWLTAKFHGPWTTNQGYWNRFCLRFGCLLGVGRILGGCCALGPWLMD